MLDVLLNGTQLVRGLFNNIKYDILYTRGDTMYTVYLHVNKINGKKYFGQTCQKLRDRWGRGSTYRNSKHFYNAIKKYGWNNFNHFIICENLTKTEADILERKLIKAYNTTIVGYNISKGGSSPMAGRNHSIYTIDKIRQARKTQVFTVDDNKKRASTMLGFEFNGIVATNRNGLEKYYPTVLDFCKAERGAKSCVLRCLSGERKTHKGYSFRYAQKSKSVI